MSYTFNKISHLKRVGLITGTKSGIGQNGGACPDWLLTEQEAERKRVNKARARQAARDLGDGYGGPAPDIDWLIPVALAAE